MLFSVSLHGQFGVDNCFECRDNSATGRKSMASGYNNLASGYCSAAIGMANEVAGDYSFVTGYQSYCSHQFSAIIGSFDTITNFHSFILGSFSKATGKNAIVVGNDSRSLANYALTIGYHVQSRASEAFTIGAGIVDNPLINNSSRSLIVGFNSNLPTFIVDRAPGINKTGKIGIGNITSPTAKLHIKADYDEDATLKLDAPGTNKVAKLILANDDNTISSTTAGGMNFHTANTGHFTFINGNVGIGTNTPDAKLHLYGYPNNSRLRLELNNLEGSYKSWDFNNDNGTLKFQYGSSTTGKPTMEDKMVITGIGNVGIGTDTPSEKLQIADGDIFIQDIDHGIIMRSPDGNCWRGTVNNNGMLEFEQIDCETLETGINNPEPSNSAQIKIYPNPAGNQVFITCEESITGLQLEINDINGQLISSQKLNNSENIINLNSFQPGTYLFRLTDKNGEQIAVEKVIKE